MACLWLMGRSRIAVRSETFFCNNNIEKYIEIIEQLLSHKGYSINLPDFFEFLLEGDTLWQNVRVGHSCSIYQTLMLSTCCREKSEKSVVVVPGSVANVVA